MFFLVVLFLASNTVPDSATQMTLDLDDKEITWTRQANGGWKATIEEAGEEAGFKVSGTKMTLTSSQKPTEPQEVDMSQFLTLPDNLNAETWKTIKEVPFKEPRGGTPVLISRDAEKKTITFSQRVGPLETKPLTVKYK